MFMSSVLPWLIYWRRKALWANSHFLRKPFVRFIFFLVYSTPLPPFSQQTKLFFRVDGHCQCPIGRAKKIDFSLTPHPPPALLWDKKRKYNYQFFLKINHMYIIRIADVGSPPPPDRGHVDFFSPPYSNQTYLGIPEHYLISLQVVSRLQQLSNNMCLGEGGGH